MRTRSGRGSIGRDEPADLRRRRVRRRSVPRQSGRRRALEPGDAPDDAWMQTVAAEMKHSETAFVQPRGRRRLRPAVVHARGRGRPLRARDARERARALRDRAARARRRRPCSTPAAASCAPTHAARRRGARSTSPPRRPSRATPPAGLFDALGIAEGRVAAHRPASSSCCVVARRRDGARRSRPTSPRCARSPTCAASTSPRPATTASTTSCRAASHRASASTRIRSPVRCTACSAPYWCERLGTTELHAHQASARGGDGARARTRRPHAAHRPRDHRAARRARSR